MQIRWLLILYPPVWRERYQEEVLALLEQHTVTWRTALDLLRGALDAWFDPYFKTPHLPPMEPALRLRRAYSTICWTFPLLVMGYMYFLDALDDAFYPWNLAHTTLWRFRVSSEVALAVGFFAFLFTGLALALILTRQAWARKKRTRRRISRNLLRCGLVPVALTLLGMVLHLLYTAVWGCAIWNLASPTVQQMAQTADRHVWPGDGWRLQIVCALIWMGLTTGYAFLHFRQSVCALWPSQVS